MNTPQPNPDLALSVLVPTHGRGPQLSNLLARLAAQTLAASRFEVIVVDDGSPEPVEIDAGALPFELTLLRQEQAGPGAARNRALAHATAPLVLILNDDAVPAADLLDRHLAAHEDAARRGLGQVSVLGTFRFTAEARSHAFVQLLDQTNLLFNHEDLVHDQLHGWTFFWTCNISLPAAAIRAVGGFDAQLFDQAIVEDVELGYRLEQAGWRILYREECVSEHDHVLTAESYFARAARLGFYSTRMWAKHDTPSMLAARDDDGVKARFDQAVTMVEAMRAQPARLVAALRQFDAENPGGPIDPVVAEQLTRAIQQATSAPWARGIHLARHGVDAYNVQDEGAPAGTSLSIAVVSCDALENTRRCIDALRAAADPRYPQQLVIVDNGSTDGSVEWLRAQADVELIENPSNLGAPRARNQAIARCTGDWVAFFDNDVFVPRGWVERALYHGAVDPGVGSVPLCANRASKRQVVPYEGGADAASIQAFADEHHAGHPRLGEDSILFTSLAVLVRRQVIEELGGFDEAFSPWGFEDDDLSLRIHLAGWRNRVARDTFVFHAPYATQEKVERHHGWMEDNWRAFVQKWSPATPIPALFDYGPLRIPDVGQASEAQLVSPLPAADAAPPRWRGLPEDELRPVAPATPRRATPAPPPAASPAPSATSRPTSQPGPTAARDWWSAPEAAAEAPARASDGRASVLVLGCGRSGTSMVTGMLAGTGWYVGDDPYPGRPANPKGFFETAEINGINEYLLSATVRDEAPLGRMQHWLTETRQQLEFDVEPALRARMDRLGRRAPFALKDPRFCYTLPAWRRAVPEAKFVCIFRDPATTATSIVKECATAEYLADVEVDHARAVRIWTESYRRVLREHSREGEWLFLHFDQLFTPDGVARLEAFVGARVAADFPERHLSRSRPAAPVDAEATALYAELCELAGAPAPAAAPARAVVTEVARPELSVVVCTYNRLETLQRCLAAFEDQTAIGRYEVVVVDDGATDGTAEWLDGWRPRCALTVVHRPNGGLAAARNSGLERARGDLVLLVNDDTIARPDLVERHLAAHAAEGPDVAVLGTFEQPRAALDNALMRVVERSNLVFCFASLAPGQRHDWTRFWTCNISVSRAAVARVGGFDEAFQHYGCEDTDLAYRLETELGIQVVHDPTARAEHEHVLSFDDLRRRTRTVAGAWATFFAKHPRALLHPHWRVRARNTVADHDAAIVRSLPERARAEAFARELAGVDVGALERTGPEGAALAEAVCHELGQYLDALHLLWWAEGEADAFRRAGVAGMSELVSRSAAAQREPSAVA